MPIQDLQFKTSVFTGTGREESTGSGLASLVTSALKTTGSIAKEINEKEERERIKKERKERAKRREENQNKEEDLLALNDYKNRLERAKIEYNYDNKSYEEQEAFYRKFVENNEYIPLTKRGENILNKIHNKQLSILNESMNEENLQVMNEYLNENILNLETIEDIDNMVLSLKAYKKDIKRSDLLKMYESKAYNNTDWSKYAGKTKKQILEDMPLLNEITNKSIKNRTMKVINKIDNQTRVKAKADKEIDKVFEMVKNGNTFGLMSLYSKKIDTYENGRKVKKNIKEIVEDTINATFASKPKKSFEFASNAGMRIKSVDAMVDGLVNGTFTNPQDIENAMKYYATGVSNGYNFSDEADKFVQTVSMFVDMQPKVKDDGTPLDLSVGKDGKPNNPEDFKEYINIRNDAYRKVLEGKGKKHKLLNKNIEADVLDDLNMNDLEDNQHYQIALDNARDIYKVVGGGSQSFSTILERQKKLMEDKSLDGIPYIKQYGVTEKIYKKFKKNMDSLGKDDVKLVYSGFNIDGKHQYTMSYKIQTKDGEETVFRDLSGDTLFKQVTGTANMVVADGKGDVANDNPITFLEYRPSLFFEKFSEDSLIGRWSRGESFIAKDINVDTDFDGYDNPNLKTSDFTSMVNKMNGSPKTLASFVSKLDKDMSNELKKLNDALYKDKFDKSMQNQQIEDVSAVFIPVSKIIEPIGNLFKTTFRGLEQIAKTKESIKLLPPPQKNKVVSFLKKEEKKIVDELKKEIDELNIPKQLPNLKGEKFAEVFDKVNNTRQKTLKKIAKINYESLKLRYPKVPMRNYDELRSRAIELEYKRLIDKIIPKGKFLTKDADTRDLSNVNALYEYMARSNPKMDTDIPLYQKSNFLYNLREKLDKRYGGLNEKETDFLLNNFYTALQAF